MLRGQLWRYTAEASSLSYLPEAIIRIYLISQQLDTSLHTFYGRQSPTPSLRRYAAIHIYIYFAQLLIYFVDEKLRPFTSENKEVLQRSSSDSPGWKTQI